MTYTTGLYASGAYNRHEDYMTKIRNKYSGYATSSVQNQNTQVSSTENTNGCTDGNDDGKIGFWDALTSMGKGAVKGVIDGVKGMFTNKEGKFSLGKTLLTVGIGALCVAFPAVGAVACGIGAIVGGVKLAKGIGNAATATTDAEAKAAFENIGDGAVTVVSSVVGAKGCVGAMKGSSTIGAVDDVTKALSNVDDAASALSKADDIAAIMKNRGVDVTDDVLRSVDDVLASTDDVAVQSQKIAEIMKANGGRTSALDGLDDSATAMQKIGAGLKDAKSSTVNNSKIIGAKVKNVKNSYDEVATAKQMKKDLGKDASTDDLKAADDLIAEAQSKTPTGKLKTEVVDTYKQTKATIKTENAAKKLYKTEADGNTDDILKATDELKSSIKELQDVTQNGYTTTYKKFGDLTYNVRESALGQYVSNIKNTKGIFKKIGTSVSKETLTAFKNNLSVDGKAVWNFLNTETGTYAQAVQQFGYDNVLEVTKTMYALGMLEEEMA